MSRRRVESFEQARWITQLYRRRWVIEQLFRTIKSKGFDIERVSMETAPFTTLCAMTLVAGVSCMQMVQDRDGAAARPLRDVFEDQDRPALEAVSAALEAVSATLEAVSATLEAVSATLEAVSATLEGKTEKQKNPHPKGSLAFAAWVCARLGGWTAYYGKPGPVVMLHGLYQFRAIQRGYRINHDVRIQ